jgi:hypothetical protein
LLTDAAYFAALKYARSLSQAVCSFSSVLQKTKRTRVRGAVALRGEAVKHYSKQLAVVSLQHRAQQGFNLSYASC